MYWIFSVKFVDLGDSCTVSRDPAMNIIITWVPVLNMPELDLLFIQIKRKETVLI